MNKAQWLVALGGIFIIGWVGFSWQEDAPRSDVIGENTSTVSDTSSPSPHDATDSNVSRKPAKASDTTHESP